MSRPVRQGIFMIVLALALALLLGSGCAVRRFAVNQVGAALASGGGTFAEDDDPDLVRDASAFSLKLMESLLAENPRHRALLLAAASGFTQYAYAFVQPVAVEAETRDMAAATALRTRARRLYLRARNYGLRGLEVNHRGFAAALRTHPLPTVRAATKRDVALLYWTAASWGAAMAMSKNDPDLVADQPIVEALIDRALALDEGFDQGAIHSFLISYEMARRGAPGDPAVRAREHFERAMTLSGGQLAAPLVSFAEQVCVAKQNRAEFEALLHKALAIDVDARPERRLENLVMQRRARWLLSRVDEFFVE